MWINIFIVMVKDIAETRNNLIQIVNDLTGSYSQMLHDKTNRDFKDNQDILFLNNQNRLQLDEIKDLTDKNSDLNKKCYDYEQIINDYQKKMVDIEEEHKCNDKVSIVKTQADQLFKQDQYIDQLQQKIKFLQGDKRNISLKFEENEDEDKKVVGGWSPTQSKTPVPQEPEKIKIDDVVKDEKDKKNVVKDVVKDVVDEVEKEDSDDSDSVEYKRVKCKNEKYYIIVGEEPQVLYEYMDDGDVGSRVGIRKKKKKGKGYDVDFD